MVELSLFSILGCLKSRLGRVSCMVDAVLLNLGTFSICELLSIQFNCSIYSYKQKVNTQSIIPLSISRGIKQTIKYRGAEQRTQGFIMICRFLLILSLLMDASPVSSSSQEMNSKPKFTFLDRILNEKKVKPLPGSLSLRPVKESKASHREETREESAKDILKKSIFKDNEPRVIDQSRDNFLMKGKMLNGVKKPIENQMANLLKNINDRIVKEIEKKEKNEETIELPILLRPEQAREEVATPSKVHFSDIFKNLRQMRTKKPFEDTLSRLTIPRSRHFSDLNPRNDPSNQSKTIVSESCPQSKKTAHSTTAPNRRSERLQALPSKKQKEILFKKGYLVYDEVGKQFWQDCSSNLSKKYLKISQKSRQLTAKAFFVVDCDSLTPIAGNNIDISIEIASISKVMTCYLALLVCKKYGIDVFSHNVRVSERAAETPGTTAELQSGDLLTVYELLLGLMLPSGNDASVALAQTMGKIIQRHKVKETKKTYYQTFIAHMNILSRQMDLEQSWSNSSGLSFSPNFSTPQAIAILTSVALKDQFFCQIINTRRHEIQIKNDRYGLTRSVVWKNTNKLLEIGWEGVKTGTTDSAGHCLMAKKGSFLVCVFDCETLARRFSECVYLHDRFHSKK